MLNKARHTKKFCILGTTIEDLAKIYEWAKLPAQGFSIVAIATHGEDGYEARVLTKGRAILDLIITVGFEVKVLHQATVFAGIANLDAVLA